MVLRAMFRRGLVQAALGAQAGVGVAVRRPSSGAGALGLIFCFDALTPPPPLSFQMRTLFLRKCAHLVKESVIQL